MPFKFKSFSDLPDVVLIEPKAFVDERGWFMESYKRSEFVREGISAEFIQDNHSRSTAKGTIRGLHYQREPAAQGKLVRCLVGKIFDVALDIRKGSPTYAKWVSATLSAENHEMLWIPPGFAHGTCATTDVSEIAYKVTTEYSAPHDRCVRWNDPAIGIKWPTTTPILSKKDAEAPILAEADNNFVWRRAE
jgi:dTDP-4-dehydrorhamnose 3,5-epimerase